MTGILMLESLTRGNTLKQGDKTPLTYRLLDADGDNMSIAGKSATVRLMYPNYLTIGYEKTGLLVSQDDTVTFTIDTVIPSRKYNVEIIVDNKFVFPSRSAESKFTIDKSSLGTEANIIEIIGVDAVVNKVLGQVDSDISQAITDITATNEAIQEAEEARKHDYSSKADYVDIVNESERGKNLFDKTKTTDGYMINSTDGKTHDEYPGWWYSDPIPVEGSRTIVRNTQGGIYQYDAEDNKILGTGNGGGWDLPVLIDHNTKVIRLNGRIYEKDALQVEYGTVPTSYEPYKPVKKSLVSDIKVTPANLEGIELGGDVEPLQAGEGIAIENNVIRTTLDVTTPINELDNRLKNVESDYADIVNESERGKNLFDKTKTTDGYMINSTDGKTHDEYPGWWYSDPIPVEGGRTIVRNTQGGIYQYDAEDNKILGTGNGTTWDLPVLIDHNTKVIRLNGRIHEKDILQVEYGTVQTSYEPYKAARKTLGEDIKVTPANLEGIELGGDVENEINNKYYKVNSDSNFTIFTRISESEFAGYNFTHTSGENYVRLWDLSTYRVVQGELIQTSENYEDPSVPMKGTQTDNHYTTDIGSTVSKVFKGHKIELSTYVRYDGGIWSVDIDGVDYGTISTWNNTSIYRTHTLADDLANADHILTLTFLGEDPDNPATTSDGTPTTPRGWINAHSGGVDKYTFVIYSTEYNNNISLEKVSTLAIGSSNKDFAFLVSHMGQETPREFFPYHSGVSTTTATTQTLSIDGEEVGITTESPLTPFSTGAFNQVLTCKLPDDTEERASVKVSFVYDEPDRVEQFLEMKFNLDSNVYSGYVFMMPANAQYIDKVTTNVRESVASLDSDIGVSKYFENPDVDGFRITMKNGMEDYYIDTAVFNRSHGLDAFWLQNRDMTIRKVYPTVFMNTDLVSGTVVYYDGYYKVGKMKDVNLMV